MRKLRIALPNKGRLKQPALELLEKTGLDVTTDGRSYIAKTNDKKIEVVFARTFDIPIYVQFGNIDLGITGHDLVLEREADIHQLLTLNFGQCKIVAAVPDNSTIEKIADIPINCRIVTEFPNISQKYFNVNGKQVEIITVRGATELAPYLGLGQLVVDISSTGETLRKNNLRVISTILRSQAVLVCKKMSYKIFESPISSLVYKMENVLS
jgi:ATP phosphoribosyltransferase